MLSQPEENRAAVITKDKDKCAFLVLQYVSLACSPPYQKKLWSAAEQAPLSLCLLLQKSALLSHGCMVVLYKMPLYNASHGALN